MMIPYITTPLGDHIIDGSIKQTRRYYHRMNHMTEKGTL